MATDKKIIVLHKKSIGLRKSCQMVQIFSKFEINQMDPDKYNYMTDGEDFILGNGKEQVYNAFKGAECDGTALLSIIISSINGNDITRIGYRAFWSCTKLSSVKIGHSVRTIDTEAFYNCKLLETLEFESESQLTSVGTKAFTYCKFPTFYIPYNVQSLSSQCFSDNSNLAKVVYCGSSAPTIFPSDIFYYSKNAIVYVSQEYIDKYQVESIGGATVKVDNSECPNMIDPDTGTPKPVLTASPSPSLSVSPSLSISPSSSISPTPSMSVSATPSLSVSATPSFSISPTPSSSVSATPSLSISPSSSVSPTPSISISPTPSNSVSATPSLSVSPSPSISISPTNSVSPSPSVSVSQSVSASASASPSRSASRSPLPTNEIELETAQLKRCHTIVKEKPGNKMLPIFFLIDPIRGPRFTIISNN